MRSLQLEEGPHLTMLHLGLPAFRMVRNKFFSVYKPPSLWCFAIGSSNRLRQLGSWKKQGQPRKISGPFWQRDQQAKGPESGMNLQGARQSKGDFVVEEVSRTAWGQDQSWRPLGLERLIYVSTWSRCLIASKTLFLSASVRVFLDKTSIWFSILCKEHSPGHQWGWASPSLLRDHENKKAKERISSLSWAETSIFSAPWTPVLLFSGLQDLHQCPSSLIPHPPTTDIQTFSLGLNHATTFLVLQL